MRYKNGFFVNRIPDKKRFQAAIKHQVSGESPFMEPDIAEHIVDYVMGRPMGQRMLKLEPRDYVEFLQRVGMDVGYLGGIWPLGRKNVVDEKLKSLEHRVLRD